jgi:hypothetical protein
MIKDLSMRMRRPAAAVCCAAMFAGVFTAGGGALAASTTWTIQKSPNATLAGGRLEAVSCSSSAACTAVGQYLNSSGITVTLAERWDGAAWQKQATANPAGDTTPSISPELLGVSCPTSGFCAAVGEYQEQFASASLAETWNGSQWTLRPFPVPADSDSPELSQVSCTSAKFCEAVGSYTDESDFDTVPLAAAWNGTTWSLQSTPSQVNSSGFTAGFTAVSCTSKSSCEAWGSGNSNNPAPDVAEQWNGASWQLQTVPSGAVAVNSMSCTSAAFCEAVGTSAAYNWNGSQWTAQTLPSSMSSAAITGVSCVSAKRCEMVGEGNVNGDDVGLAAAWNGSAWSSQSTPNPAKATWVNLNAVSCTSATSCEAAGDSEVEVTANDPRALAETWNGSSWALQTAAAPAGATNNTLSDVSCVSASFCAAVGTHFNDAGNQVNLAEIWNGTSWLIKAAPDLTSEDGAADSELYSVSCVSASFCQAVGTGPAGADAALWNGSSWTTQAIVGGADVDPQEVSCATADFCMLVNGFGGVATWNGSSWSAGTSVTGFSYVGSVSCLSATFCEIVGEGPAGENAAAWNGTSWVAQTTPGPVSNSLNSVSCTAPTSCEAAGQTPGSNGNPTPLAEAWDGSAWTIQSAPAPANSQSSLLAAVSCTSATSCTAVGQDQSTAVANFGTAQTLAEVWDGTAWTIATTPDPSSTEQNLLTGVSCGASNACTAVGQYDDLGEIPATLVEAGN